MSQTDLNVANASGAAVRADINAHLDALVSQNSGATAPTTTFPNQWWLDTSTNILKQRDNANTAWVNVASKVGTNWIPYRNGITLDAPSQAEAEAGTATIERVFTAQRVKQAIVALESGAGGLPTGTVLLFHQSAAPTGWTKDVAATLDNSALRIVTSTAWASGKQGATAFTSVFGSGKTAGNKTSTGTVGNTTISETQMPAHTHVSKQNTASTGGDGVNSVDKSTTPKGDASSGSTGGGGSHNHTLTMDGHDHTLSLDLNYINMIIATKD